LKKDNLSFMSPDIPGKGQDSQLGIMIIGLAFRLGMGTDIGFRLLKGR
jgi:hypothetical protein